MSLQYKVDVLTYEKPHEVRSYQAWHRPCANAGFVHTHYNPWNALCPCIVNPSAHPTLLGRSIIVAYECSSVPDVWLNHDESCKGACSRIVERVLEPIASGEGCGSFGESERAVQDVLVDASPGGVGYRTITIGRFRGLVVTDNNLYVCNVALESVTPCLLIRGLVIEKVTEC